MININKWFAIEKKPAKGFTLFRMGSIGIYGIYVYVVLLLIQN